MQTTSEGPAEGRLEAAIDACEARYRERGLPAIFKLTRASRPADLDARLAARGYGVVDETVTQVAELGDAPLEAAPVRVRIAGVLEPEWLAARCALGGYAREEAESLRGVLERIAGAGACAFASIERDGATGAQGLAVARSGTVCLSEIAVAEPERRRGLGGAVVRALLAWAQARDSELAWLQVVATNTAARRLYEGQGFREAYRYWYRVGS